MSLWSWTVRDRHVVGVSEAPDLGISALVTLDWGPGSFPWGEARFPSLRLLSVISGGAHPARVFNPVLTISLPAGGGLDRQLAGPGLPPGTIPGSRVSWLLDSAPITTIVPGGLGILAIQTLTLPSGARLLFDPVSGVNSVLSLDGAGSGFPPQTMDAVIVTGILE